MANLSIPSIRERLFNTSKHEQVTQRNSSNPFAVSSFKGNVLTADVFESSTKQNQPAFTGKLKASALVGSISGIGERFQNIINSVVGFGNRIKENVVNTWNKLEGIEISFNPLKEMMTSAYRSAKEGMSSAYRTGKEILFDTPVTELISSNSREIKRYAHMTDMAEARTALTNAVGAWEAAMV